MISPEQIRQQAEKWWPSVLRSGLSGEPFFPKNLTRIGKVKKSERLTDFERIRAQQNALLRQSKAQTGAGYSLHWRERDFRDIGRNRFIDRISIDSLEDYLSLLRRRKAYDRVVADARRITGRFPALADWCEENPLEIEAHHEQWPDLLKVVSYFLNRHESGRYYIRELPVEVPTKFVETHRRILASLLDAVLPPESIDETQRGVKAFEQRYGLKYRQPQVRLRLLDDALARQYFSGLQDLSIPLDDFASLELPLQRVIILENKTNFSNLMNFLTLPQLKGGMGLFGSGFALGRFSGVSWLREVELLYWGDLDAHGLQMLSQIRGYFPQVRPFLMDRQTLDAFPAYLLTDAPRSSAGLLPHLTESEQALFDYLNDNRLRLEQERIPLDYVRRRLEG